MRAVVVLLLLSVAAPCWAEDPLESLNTVEETLIIMEQNLQAQQLVVAELALERDASGSGGRAGEVELGEQEVYSISEHPPGLRQGRDCVAVEEHREASLHAEMTSR